MQSNNTVIEVDHKTEHDLAKLKLHRSLYLSFEKGFLKESAGVLTSSLTLCICAFSP